MKSNKKLLLNTLLVCSFIAICLSISSYYGSSLSDNTDYTTKENTPILTKNILFGFDLDVFKMTEKTIQKNEFLSEILTREGVAYSTIHELSQKAQNVYDVRNLREGKNCVIVKDSCGQAEAFIYVPSAYQYVRYNLKDSIYAEVVRKDVEKCREVGTGIIESTLWDAMLDANMSPSLIGKMEDALACSIDFYHTQKKR